MNFKEAIFEFLLFEEKGKSLLLLDIDETLLKPRNIYVYRKLPTDKKEVRLTPEEYAKDPNSVDKKNKKYYDYREFMNQEKIARSIKTGLPIVPNLKVMDDYIKKGWKIGILTARGLEDIIAKTMQEWLKFKNKKGNFVDIDLPRKLVYAINDDNKRYKGSTDFEKKVNVIRKLAKEYDRIIFIDDTIETIKKVKKMAKEEGLNNIMAKYATAKLKEE
jgi:hypothetical protein